MPLKRLNRINWLFSNARERISSGFSDKKIETSITNVFK